MKTSNKGFSYVEFILVIAIMAILVGVMALSMGLIGRTNINRGIEKVSSSLNQARNSSMARGSIRGAFEISYDGTQYYCYVGAAGAADKEELQEELVASPVIVGYYLAGDADTMYQVTESNPLRIQYNQSTGSFKPITLADGSEVFCDRIVMIHGDKVAEIKLYPETGKTELVY